MSFLNHLYEDPGAIIAAGEPSVVNTTDNIKGSIIATPVGKKAKMKLVRRNQKDEKDFYNIKQ